MNICIQYCLPSVRLTILFTILLSISKGGATSYADEAIDFNRDVRAILSQHCFECHGPDTAKREADLRLDVQSEARDAVTADEQGNSSLLERIESDDMDLVMPPPDAKKPLSREQIEILRQWTAEGASYKRHWAFEPITKPAVRPDALSEIDYFIQRKLREADLNPSPIADRRTLIRRVSLDLTGLPPTPEETKAFLNDDAQGAYSRVVERLLASPHYGENMALPWLEAARYADTSGYQADWERFMWPWRNWVINAFNSNMPYDQFTIEQIAGDMLPDATREQILATGFNRNHRINDEGGVIAAEYAVEYVVDRVDTTSTVWLGLTMGCSRCHDHKYDPLPQQDFYNMFALFNNVPEKGKDGRLGYSLPILDYPDPEFEGVIGTLDQQLQTANAQLVEAVATEHVALQGWLAELEEQILQPTTTQWSVLAPRSLKGSGGVKFKQQRDLSFLASGKSPAKSTYSATIPTDQLASFTTVGLTGILIEALTHESLSNKSLSRSPNGNFVLSEVRLEVVRGKETIPLKISHALADHAQEGYPASQAIDGDPATGWAVEGHVKRENRSLLLTLDAPFCFEAEDRLKVQMQHSSQFAQHSIGRVRLSGTNTLSPTLEGISAIPANVVAAIRTISGRKGGGEAAGDERDVERTKEEAFNTLRKYFGSTSRLFKKQRDEVSRIEDELSEAKKKQFVKVMVMSEMETPRETFVLQRGLYDQPDSQRRATADAPAAFGGLGERPHNRLGFAQWLVADDNPLVARVAVNRIWQQLMGRGLVETVEDFGSQGTPPSHPELLDWLASDFRDNGWDTKRLVKQIVASRAYRQSSVVNDKALEVDPKNRLLSRASRVRLSGYQLRDQALAASGLLVPTIGGPSVKPYQPPGLWSEVSFQQKNRTTDFYVQDHGNKLYRRGLYTFWKRSVAPPMLANFDAAGREMCTVRMTRTSTPLQALNLLNDVTFIEAARGMATRMLDVDSSSREEQMHFGLELVGITPDKEKVQLLGRAYEKYTKHFSKHPSDAEQLLANGESKQDSSFPTIELAAMTSVASVILNLDETVTRQ